MSVRRIGAVLLGVLTACTTPKPVTPGEVFAGPFISVRAPTTGDWHLQSKSDTVITFTGGEVGNTFAAAVGLFRLGSASTPQEYEALIRENAARDVDPDHPNRYELLEQTITYSNERPYPCVRYRAVSKDHRAKGTKEPQYLELDGLYCRHPMDPTAGAAIMYTHRGLARHTTLRDEAERFIQGAELPSK